MEKTANGIPSGERSPSGKPWPRTGGCNTWQPCKFSSEVGGRPPAGDSYPARDAGGGDIAPAYAFGYGAASK
jgi:hypothetical protein